MESILVSVKKMLGVSQEDVNFDPDIIMHINTVLMALNQIGIGPVNGFTIVDETQKWTDLLGDRKDLEGVKTYIGLKVRLLFDPPTSSFVLEAMKEQIKELEWRLNSKAEYVEPVTTPI